MTKRFEKTTRAVALAIALSAAFTASAEATPQTQSAQSPLTLDQALEIAFKNSPDMRSALKSVESSKWAVKEARARFNPTFTARSNTVYSGPISTMNVGGASVAMQASPDTTANLAVALPLDISRQLAYATDVARFRFQAQYLSMVAVSERLIVSVKTGYYNLLRAEGQLEAAQADVDGAKARLEVIKAKKEEGTVPQFDVTSAEVDLQNLLRQLIVAKNNVSLAQAALNGVLGIDVVNPTQVAPMEVKVETKTVDAGESIKTAQERRPELKAASAAVSAAKANIRLQDAALMPSLSISGGPAYDFNPTGFGGDNYSWSATIAVSVPIWDGGVTKARAGQAKAAADTAKADLESAKLAVATEVRRAALNLQEAALRIETTERSVALATDALSIATDRYEAGIAVLVEVTSAQSQLTQARVSHVNARYDYAVALATLQRVTSSQPELGQLQLLADPAAAKAQAKGARS